MAQIRRRGPNRYLISLYIGRDDQGKRKYHNEYFHGTKTEAQQRAAELQVTLKSKRGPASLAMTVGKYLDSWLKKIKGTISERTLETYTWHVKKLIPVVGHLQFYNLTAYELQEGLSKLQGKPKTIKGIYGTLKTAFRQAVAWGKINSDPTAGLRAPRVPREEKTVLTPEELVILLEAAKGYKYYLIIRLLALTGARLGEILGLKWQDIDFKKGKLTIIRSADGRHRKLNAETKTTSSRRTLKLDTETVNLLKAYKKEQKVVSLKDDILVFSYQGRVIREDAVRRTLRYALKKAGLNHIRVHDLRHTAGSLLLDAGYSLPSVSAFLGHSSPATTAAVYAHAVRKGESIANILDADQNADQNRKDQ